jgi:hypothetical protein
VRRLLPVAALAAVLVTGSARAAACSPLSCAPSQFTLDRGTLLAVRGDVSKPVRVIDLRTGRTRWWLPAGVVTGDVLVHADGNLVTWFDAATGARIHDTLLPQNAPYALVGTSQDAQTAVLARTQHRSTSFALVTPARRRIVTLTGRNWQFDALNGRYLYLIRTLRYGYQVRLYDLTTNRLQPQPLKDPHESALIQGIPFARASSADGRYLFTLYVGSNGNAMVHELDTASGFAYCIDLPGDGDFGAAITWALVPDERDGTLWAVSVGYGRVVGIDVASHVVRLHFSFQRATWTANAGVAALSPDGSQIAVTDAQHTWFVTPASATVRRGPNHTAIALAYAPDQQRLWVVGGKSRVSSLRVR